MTNYEFKILSGNVKDAEASLNEMGKNGWQLVSANEVTPTVARYYMQRPIQLGSLGIIGG